MTAGPSCEDLPSSAISAGLTVGAALRTTQDAAGRESQRTTALLRALDTHVRDAERDRLFAEVDITIAELMRAAGREP